MNKVIIIPVVVYIVSLLLSFFFSAYLGFSPMMFAFMLFLWWIWLRKSVDIHTAEGRDLNLIVVYSCTAGIIAPVFAGILTVFIQ